MRSTIISAVAFAACASAYTVLTPGGASGWTTDPEQAFTWSRVNTDPLNFSAILTNNNRALMPDGVVHQVLFALVDGTLERATVKAPASTGWPVGKGFRLNFCRDSLSPNDILAQSQEFEIRPNTTSSSSRLTSTPVNTPIANTPAPVQATTPAPSSSRTSNPPANGASANGVQGGLLGLAAVLGLLVI
ncbi:hypothetical protein HGRIS_013634 [Hohenbuehelia grisea]|uniref:Uncharacterized protein n=1 Tax=Hohenbuehelia grisea TaxID=104357 RepID=A0ABR3IW87_9AGAR